eukprot:SAG31_NODE_67_length_28318_cov_6.493674_6_plen_70_part_00
MKSYNNTKNLILVDRYRIHLFKSFVLNLVTACGMEDYDNTVIGMTAVALPFGPGYGTGTWVPYRYGRTG